MIRTAETLGQLPAGEHQHVTIRSAVPGDVAFLDHLQKTFSHQVGFLPKVALEQNIARGTVSIALENDEPAAYLLGKGQYLRDPHFGIIYQAAVSYDARRRLMGTALVQHFIDHMAPGPPDMRPPDMRPPDMRLIGLWCAQDIEANEFWNACGFEAIAARHGSRRKGRVHIFWVGRTPGRGASEPLRYPRYTKGGLMREQREVFGLAPGSEYKDVALPAPPERPAGGGIEASGHRGNRGKRGGKAVRASLAEMQRAYRYGQTKHICVVIAGVSKYLPVAPFDMPNFTDLAKALAPGPPGMAPGSGSTEALGTGHQAQGKMASRSGSGGLWTPARGVRGSGDVGGA